MSSPKRIQTPQTPQGLNHSHRVIKAIDFETVTFFDPKQDRQVIVLYTLGADGILREFSSGKWNAFPITE